MGSGPHRSHPSLQVRVAAKIAVRVFTHTHQLRKSFVLGSFRQVAGDAHDDVFVRRRCAGRTVGLVEHCVLSARDARLHFESRRPYISEW